MTDAVGDRSSEKPEEKARRIWAEIDEYEMRSNAAHQKEWVVLYHSCLLTRSSKKRLPNPSAGASAGVHKLLALSLSNLLAIFNHIHTSACAHSPMQMPWER